MYKKDDLENFLFLFSKAAHVPFTNWEDASVNNFNALDVPFTDYCNSIIGWWDCLRIEISENLLSLPADDKLFYLKYLIHKLKAETGEYDNYNLIDVLKYYKVDSMILDFSKNMQLKELLQTSFKSISGDENLIKLRDLHREYYQYLLNIERDDILKHINNLLIMIENKEDFSKKLKWIGKPSQLGFIVGKLAELGYIETPTHKSGDINYTHFAKLVKSTFECETTEASLSKYLNLESDKGQETVRKFKENKFNIPHLKVVS